MRRSFATLVTILSCVSQAAGAAPVTGESGSSRKATLLVRSDTPLPDHLARRIVHRFQSVPGLVLIAVANRSVETVTEQLASVPGVRYVERDELLAQDDVPNDPSFGSLWGCGTSVRTAVRWTLTSMRPRRGTSRAGQGS